MECPIKRSIIYGLETRFPGVSWGSGRSQDLAISGWIWLAGRPVSGYLLYGCTAARYLLYGLTVARSCDCLDACRLYMCTLPWLYGCTVARYLDCLDACVAVLLHVTCCMAVLLHVTCCMA